MTVRSEVHQSTRSMAGDRLTAACLVWVLTLTAWAGFRAARPEPIPSALWLTAFGAILLAAAAMGRRRWARLGIIGIASILLLDVVAALGMAAAGVAAGQVAPHEGLLVWLHALPGGAAPGPALLGGVVFTWAMLRHPDVRASFNAGKRGVPNSTQRGLAAMLLVLYGLVVVAYGVTQKVTHSLSDRARKPVPQSGWALRGEPLVRTETRLSSPLRPRVEPDR
ncbi:MAG TPA: hypothetical protein VLH79_00455 [Chthonomonadales bacterium]|nr:hypothetical protein [Chthonomonadales bacterium]